jgi:hypothetical protein
MNLVLFDIDGTLTLTNEVDNRCYLCALGEALGTTGIGSGWTKYPDATDSSVAAVLWETRHGRRTISGRRGFDRYATSWTCHPVG